jgi:amidase
VNAAERAVGESLERIAARPELNAVITLCADEARARARAGVSGRLAGVPLLVKDLIDTAGIRTTYASALYRDHVPQRSAPAVRALEAEGAIVVGKANADEFAWGVCGQNVHYGDTVNPVAPDRVAGGSSSGNGAALAAGMVPLAIGTDTGGSVRIPAACCGVAGLKTTWGRIPLAGVHPLSPSYDTVGPIARDVAGLVLGMQLLEPGFAPRPVDRPVVARIRPPASPGSDAAVDRALAATGWEIVEKPVPWWFEIRSYGRLLGAEGARANAELPRHLLNPVTRTAIERGVAVPRERVMELRAGLAEVQLRFLRLLDGVHALALPTLDRPTPRLTDRDLRLVQLTFPVNAARLPAVSVPVPGGSLQLVGRPYAEETLLGLAVRF